MADLSPEELAALPSGFARLVLGLNPYPWQCEAMDAVALGKSVALAAANESGKTSVVAASLLLWQCSIFPGSQVVTTAGVYRQVKEQLWPTIAKYRHLIPEVEIAATHARFNNGSRALGFSTDDPGRFEGFHGNEDAPLLIIVDEAKSVPRGIFDAIERCRPQKLLIMSSTGDDSGVFYECFNKNRKFYHTIKVTAFDCPHLLKEKIDEQIEKFGEKHPLIRSMVYSEFISSSDKPTIFTRDMVRECMGSQPVLLRGPKMVFIDFGGAGAETVMGMADGNDITMLAWRDANEMASVGRCITELKTFGVEASNVFGDEGGIGGPMIRRMAEMGWNINAVNFGKPAYNEIYKNRGTEIWHEARKWVESRRVKLPHDDLLMDQLVDRYIVYDSTGRTWMESKEMLSSRGVHSPDRADAVCGVIWAMQHHTLTNRFSKARESFMNKLDRNNNPAQAQGYWTG